MLNHPTTSSLQKQKPFCCWDSASGQTWVPLPWHNPQSTCYACSHGKLRPAPPGPVRAELYNQRPQKTKPFHTGRSECHFAWHLPLTVTKCTVTRCWWSQWGSSVPAPPHIPCCSSRCRGEVTLLSATFSAFFLQNPLILRKHLADKRNGWRTRSGILHPEYLLQSWVIRCGGGFDSPIISHYIKIESLII